MSLRKRGYDVIPAVDGADALAKAIEHIPDLVLLDVMMPKMNGFDVLFALKLVGACYLAYLGIRTLLESRQRPADLLAGAPPAAPAHAVFRQGFLSAISNPKLGVFFVTFLPQFVLPGQAVLSRLLVLGVIFAVIGYLWMNLYGLFVTRLREVITAPRVRQWMQRVTGVVLLGFSARLAVERI